MDTKIFFTKTKVYQNHISRITLK